MYIADSILCFKVGLGNHPGGITKRDLLTSGIYGNLQAYFTKNDVMSEKSISKY